MSVPFWSKPSKPLALLATLTLFAAACGDDDDDGEAGATTVGGAATDRRRHDDGGHRGERVHRRPVLVGARDHGGSDDRRLGQRRLGDGRVPRRRLGPDGCPVRGQPARR